MRDELCPLHHHQHQHQHQHHRHHRRHRRRRIAAIANATTITAATIATTAITANTAAITAATAAAAPVPLHSRMQSQYSVETRKNNCEGLRLAKEECNRPAGPIMIRARIVRYLTAPYHAKGHSGFRIQPV